MNTITEEKTIPLFGLVAKAYPIRATDNGRIISQKIKVSKKIRYYGKPATITATLRLDDQCRNGHEEFSITGEIWHPNRRDCETCGCIHEDIEKHFPQLKHLIKWHLMGIGSPMHYIGNTTYYASNRDHNGKLKGEPTHFEQAVYFGDSPIANILSDKFAQFLKERQGTGDFLPLAVPHINRDGDTYKFADKYTFIGFEREWHLCPFDNLREAQEFSNAMRDCKARFASIPTSWSEGKERDFKAARSCAKWEEATDEQLSLPKAELEELLKARLPQLISDFRVDMIECGFKYPTLPEGKEHD